MDPCCSFKPTREQMEGRQASGRNEKKETRAHQGKVLS